MVSSTESKNRAKRVIIGDAIYKWASVNIGNTQGTALGPILFIIFIRKGKPIPVKFFADDSRITCAASDTESRLQDCIVAR
jgi:hypothetical protein